MLRLHCDKCGYQYKRLLNTCICDIDPRKVILLKSTATHTIVVHGVYVYDSNYDYAQFKSNEKYNALFDSTIT